MCGLGEGMCEGFGCLPIEPKRSRLFLLAVTGPAPFYGEKSLPKYGVPFGFWVCIYVSMYSYLYIFIILFIMCTSVDDMCRRYIIYIIYRKYMYIYVPY